jgi:hypothetical protein
MYGSRRIKISSGIFIIICIVIGIVSVIALSLIGMDYISNIVS